MINTTIKMSSECTHIAREGLMGGNCGEEVEAILGDREAGRGEAVDKDVAMCLDLE